MVRRPRALGVILFSVLAASPALVAGCSEEPRLTRADFQERANDRCQTLRRASEEFSKAQAPGAEGAEVARYLHRGSDELRVLVDRLDRLSPPSEMEEDADELLDVLRDYAGGLDTLADRTGGGQTFQEVLQENPDVVRRLNRLAGRATELVATLGLVGCVLPS